MVSHDVELKGLTDELAIRLNDIARSLDAVGLVREGWELGGASATALRVGHRHVPDVEIFMPREAIVRVADALKGEPLEGVFQASDVDVTDQAIVLRRGNDGHFVIFRSGNTLLDKGELLEIGDAGSIAVQTEREVIGRYIYHRSAEITGRELFDISAIISNRSLIEYDKDVQDIIDLRYSSLAGRLSNWRLQSSYQSMIDLYGDPLNGGGYEAAKRRLTVMAYGQILADRPTMRIETPDNTFAYADKLKKALEYDHYPLPRETMGIVKSDLYLNWTWNTNAIEGNTLTLAETRDLLRDGTVPEGRKLREILEAVNHRSAISLLEEAVADNVPLNHQLILSLHRAVMQGIDDSIAGRYRSGNVYIETATIQPPRGGDFLERQMESLLSWHDSPDAKELHPIARAAELHTRFVAIHPFSDGNGRTARLLLNYELMRSGYFPAVVRNADRDLYLDAIDRSVATGDYAKVHEIVAQAEAETILRYLKSTDHDHEIRRGGEIAPREARLSPSESDPDDLRGPTFGPGL